MGGSTKQFCRVARFACIECAEMWYNEATSDMEVQIMTRFELMVEDHVKQEADELFASLGLDTATAIRIFLRASIARAGIPFSVAHYELWRG